MPKGKPLTVDDFIERAISVHGDRYDYSLVKKVRAHVKVSIICKIHGVFTQTPNSHFSGSNCRKCSFVECSERISFSIDDFLRRCETVHGDKYSYENINYSSLSNYVNITCQEHGIFKQLASNHIQGRGCPNCGDITGAKKRTSGWSYGSWIKLSLTSKKFDSFKVYIIKCWNDKEEFYKIGKTFYTVKERFSSTKIPYEYKIINIVTSHDARLICRLEKELHLINKDLKYIPRINFGGMGECFKW